MIADYWLEPIDLVLAVAAMAVVIYVLVKENA